MTELEEQKIWKEIIELLRQDQQSSLQVGMKYQLIYVLKFYQEYKGDPSSQTRLTNLQKDAKEIALEVEKALETPSFHVFLHEAHLTILQDYLSQKEMK